MHLQYYHYRAGIPSELGIVVLVGPALVLAILLHPNLNNNWFTDSAWAFALYLEAVAMLPQLVMFQNAVSTINDGWRVAASDNFNSRRHLLALRDRSPTQRVHVWHAPLSLSAYPLQRNMEVEPFEANFVFSIAVARMLHFVFWLSSYHELNDKYSDGWCMAAQRGFRLPVAPVMPHSTCDHLLHGSVTDACALRFDPHALSLDLLIKSLGLSRSDVHYCRHRPPVPWPPGCAVSGGEPPAHGRLLLLLHPVSEGQEGLHPAADHLINAHHSGDSWIDDGGPPGLFQSPSAPWTSSTGSSGGCSGIVQALACGNQRSLSSIILASLHGRNL